MGFLRAYFCPLSPSASKRFTSCMQRWLVGFSLWPSPKRDQKLGVPARNFSMPEQLWFTAILNHLFASAVTSLLLALHIKPKYPMAPIPNSLAMELLVFSFLLILFLMVRSRLSMDRPGALQHMFEGVEGFVQGQSDEII